MNKEEEKVEAVKFQIIQIVKSWKRVIQVITPEIFQLNVTNLNGDEHLFVSFTENWLILPNFPLEDKLIKDIVQKLEEIDLSDLGLCFRISMLDVEFTSLIPLVEQSYRFHLLS